MTRFLERDKKYQVNANLIGVQVRPQVVPPTYEVAEVEANVQVEHCDSQTTWTGLPMVSITNNNVESIWGYNGENKVVDGVTYNTWICLYGLSDPSQFVPGGVIYTQDGTTITDQTQFFVYVGDVDPSAPSPMMPGPVSEYKFDYDGYLLHYDPNDNYYIADDEYFRYHLNGNPECGLVDGFFVSKETGHFIGLAGSRSTEFEMNGGRYYGDTNGFATWKFSFNVDVFLYSSVRNPSVGDNLMSNPNGTEAYLSSVTEVYQEEVDPGYTEAVDCKVSYSVDGETWTDWSENLTDDNNVIANIPRYMFLKFSQDVEITEE